ncbi:WXG100 family type VII secretion target [Bifidobacterium canis]|uniref:ESAT-6-like protein n=1 Tax=Bifidobacterium canis TaxID=2610880 RepID=A0A7K1J4Z6_9BIFI|nr:WXG100 family type VII secretion target [Bifidobacterium canis]MUH59733.1 hypothetical protein [Bifidobacterium canis]
MSQFQVDSERISASSAAVCSSIGAIRDAVNGMYANLNALQEAWRGSAATQFNAVAAQWRNAQQQMEQSLEAMQHALTQASTLYADAEMQASRLFTAS